MDITVEELKQKRDNKEDFVFIDVREEYEYEDFNLGAKLIPLGNIMAEADSLSEFKESEIVIHCRSGARSAAAQQMLQGMGFSNVRNLIGGVLAWQQAYVK